MTAPWRFRGWIAGAGTSGGTRLVLGHWPDSPFGAFSDVMVAHPDGRRELLAPSGAIADFVSATYTFETVSVVPITVSHEPALAWRRARPAGGCWQVTTPQLSWTFTVGLRHPLGAAVAALPERVASHRRVATALNPVASTLLPGVRTSGVTRAPGAPARVEWYAGRDLHRLSGSWAQWDGRDLGAMAPVSPAPLFGFSGTPTTPSLTRVVSTVDQVPS